MVDARWKERTFKVALSYINQYGEGPTSDWVQVEQPIAKGVHVIILTLHPVLYSGQSTRWFSTREERQGRRRALQQKVFNAEVRFSFTRISIRVRGEIANSSLPVYYASYLPPHALTTRKVLVAEVGGARGHRGASHNLRERVGGD